MKKTNVDRLLASLSPRSFEIKGKSTYAYDKVVVFDEKDIGVDGAKYQIISFPPGSSVSPHFHKNVREVFLIARGEGIITVNGQDNHATPGGVFLIQPGDFHSLKNNGKTPFVLHIFKWNEDPLDITWS